jgi:dienelactone hydrolase
MAVRTGQHGWQTAAQLAVLASAVAGKGAWADPGAAGPYAAGWRDVTIGRPNNTTFPARVYYPAVGGGGLNALLDDSGAPYAAVTFGHGFLQPISRYHSTLVHLSTWGFLVMASESGMELFPSHSAFAADLSHCLAWLEEQNVGAGGWLQGKVDVTAMGASGHSMGGGCSILAAAADPRIRAVANLAAANTNPSAIAQMSTVAVPVSLIAGSSDTITPVQQHGMQMYAAGSAPKLLPLIQGGWHCGFQDVSSFGCDSGPLPRAQQLELARRLLTSFFLLYLKQDQSMWSLVWGPGATNDPRVTTIAVSGISISPAPVVMEAPGGYVATAHVMVQNVGPAPAAFALEIEGGLWSAAVIPQQTGVLAPGCVAAVEVRLEVPAGGAATDEAILSARSLVDGATRAWASVEASRSACWANCDGSTVPPVLNVNDFTCFINQFAAAQMLPHQQQLGHYANCDASTVPPVLNVADFTCFINAFAAGCR